MNGLASKHDRNRQRRCLVVAVLLLAAAFCTHSQSFASCGDYLVHDWQPSGTATAAQEQGISAESLALPSSLAFGSPVNLPEPVSPCASGRCHSLPLWPPANHPSRLATWKEAATVAAIANPRRDDDSIQWSFPTDGSLPNQPLLAIAVPPPRQAGSQS